MKPLKPTLLTLFLLFALQFTASAATACISQHNDSIIDEEELLQWLEQYATEVKQKTEEVKTSAKEENTKPTTKPTATKKATTPTAKNRNNTTITSSKKTKITTNNKKLVALSPSELISADDSLTIHQESLVDFVYNPLFLDWIIGKEYGGAYTTLDREDSTITSIRRKIQEDILRDTALLYRYHISQIPNYSEIEDKTSYKKQKIKQIEVSNSIKVSDISINMPKKSPWSYGAQFQAHVTQNYITPNWYNGGESSLSGIANVTAFCKYSKGDLQWDNEGEWKLGVNGGGKDTLRMVRVNDDYLKLNSKLGYKAFNKFFATVEANFQTQLFNTYKANTYVRTSGPLSPIRFNLSVGLDYKYKNDLSVFLSPFSYKLIYVTDTTYKKITKEESIPYQVGINNGERTINQLGALLRVNYKHDFTDAINMEVKFYFFGNYYGTVKGVELDCEVIGNFRINRFFSAKVSLNPRYDSTLILADGSKPKLQFRELISVGFNYKI